MVGMPDHGSKWSNPSISTAREFKALDATWPKPPWGLVSMTLTVTLRGTFSFGGGRTRVATERGKAEFRETVANWGLQSNPLHIESCEVRLKQSFSNSSEASLGGEIVFQIKIGDLTFPLAVSLGFELTHWFPRLKLKVDSPELDIAQLLTTGFTRSLSSGQKPVIHFGNDSFSGTVRVSGSIALEPDVRTLEKNVGYNALIRGGQAVTRVVCGSSAATFAFVVAWAAAITIVHARLGLFIIDREHEKGDAQAAGHLFSAGYATKLAELTDPNAPVATGDPLLSVDWSSFFKDATAQYVDSRILSSSESPDTGTWARLADAKSAIEKCGRAAAVQDCDQFVKQNSPNGWATLRKYFTEKAGNSVSARKSSFLSTLTSQVLNERDLRIDFPPAGWH
jgi:hypothetical protein